MARKKIPVNGILLLHYIAGGKRSDCACLKRSVYQIKYSFHYNRPR
jgi:hypothetical protein